MIIPIGSDHAGFSLKEKIKKYLEEKAYQVDDFGATNEDSVDYPDIGFKLAEKVSEGKYAKGILLCGSGIGMSIVANKVLGIRAALCINAKFAKLSRLHNDANILVMPARFIEFETAKEIVDIWFAENFEAGRHLKRINKISAYEKNK